ncbi:O-antigen ligase family protein [Enterobacter bugandensis]|uniref:O-antigen ligase family protein n=1 Tax=Enterobacter bugandensis TaxID=881260 RepID=UPI0022E62014|nr:O-antigen ligase family protein [Enterobacter bugandensis]
MNVLYNFPVYSAPRRTFLRPLQDLAIPALVSLYLLFILPVYFDNNAGSGLNLPQNILAWGTMILCTLIALFYVLWTGCIQTGRFLTAATLSMLLMLLPWMWTSNSLWRLHALPRMAGIVGALLFAWALCQMRLTPILRRGLMTVVVMSALIQSGEAMIQAWLPETSLRLMEFSGTSVYGIFQQRNLLASWLATGVCVALYLALTSRSHLSALGWISSVYPMCTALTLTQSRTGILGLALSVLLVAVADRRRVRNRPLALLRRLMLVSSLLVWCAGISLFAMPSGESADLVHTASTDQRVRVLKGGIELFRQHPMTGSGLGSFEASFPEALADAGLISNESDTFTHPHNEVLYVADEGGIVALTGLLILAGVWIWPLVWRLRHKASPDACSDTGRWLDSLDKLSAGGWLLPLTGLPIVIHMMVEYPLYLSSPHLLLLLVLFRIGLPDDMLHIVHLQRGVRSLLLPGIALPLVIAICVLQAGFIVQSELTLAEQEMNKDVLPTLPYKSWQTITQSERLDRDQHMLSALTPGFLQRPVDTSAFYLWGQRWLAVHNDAEVSAAMMLIAQRRGDHKVAERLRVEAARVFVHDQRFK